MVSCSGLHEKCTAHGCDDSVYCDVVRCVGPRCTGRYKDLSVRTVVIPAGDKPSVVADAPEDYAKDTSPDKGAVACYLEDPSHQSPLQLLLVNCHLYGTNKYGVREAVFDKVSSPHSNY